MKLIKGQKYEVSEMTVIGWIIPRGEKWLSGKYDGYNVADYFRDGIYLGADEDGIEPIFAE